jgi:hypothetical protein
MGSSRFGRRNVGCGGFLPERLLAFSTTRLRRFDGFLFLVLATSPPALFGLFDRYQIDGGSCEVTGPTGQERDPFVFDIEGEPPPSDGGDTDRISLPAPQFTTAMTEDDEVVIESDDHLEFGCLVAVELDTPIEGEVFAVGWGLGHGHLRRIGA